MINEIWKYFARGQIYICGLFLSTDVQMSITTHATYKNTSSNELVSISMATVQLSFDLITCDVIARDYTARDLTERNFESA